MGISANGQICFGVVFDELFEFPWDLRAEDEERDEDEEALKEAFEDWWSVKVCGFKYSKKLYDRNGNRLPGITAKDVEASYRERKAFDEAHPAPVCLVNYCSADYAMRPRRAELGQDVSSRLPEGFRPSGAEGDGCGARGAHKFCTDHGIEMPSEPQWIPSSYMG